ncbi:hypothetical protein C8J57DRAFT_1255111 [Mycena rebaudengoi]|nr:hypothetical protein C8J57DRAFT_1255111 [Mycena rebaudengoi]
MPGFLICRDHGPSAINSDASEERAKRVVCDLPLAGHPTSHPSTTPMSPSGVAHYDEELKYLARLLRALPEAISLGDCHDFIGYIPGPKKIAVAGCTQTVVSHALAASFNRSNGSVAPIIFQSRGTELEEVTTVLRRYITGNAGSNGLLVSWVDDLTTAVTSAITTADIPLPRKVNITAAKRLMEDRLEIAER